MNELLGCGVVWGAGSCVVDWASYWQRAGSWAYLCAVCRFDQGFLEQILPTCQKAQQSAEIEHIVK